MAINTKKVVVGGLAAGVVIVVADWIINGVLLADRMKAEIEAFRPGGSAVMESGSTMAAYIMCDLVIGLLLVWTYAAIRPRFGPGPKTAFTAAILFWLLAGVFTSGYLIMGVMSMGTWWIVAIMWLIILLIGAWVGAMLYTEEGTAAAAA